MPATAMHEHPQVIVMRGIKRIIAVSMSIVLVAVLLAPGGDAQTSTPPDAAAAPAFKAEELEQIVAPIALYPDPLIAQIFMAATYPVEIVQAARFAKANASLQGDQLNEELQKQTWDDSVKSLVSFPQVLTMMSDKLDWTQKLGDAFLAQQKDVMDAVQRLRTKAQAAGNLKTTPQQNITVEQVASPATAPAAAPAQTTIIKIEPANPQVIYVPTYEPTVVYGGWPYPAYPPYAYYPPGYVAGTALLSFGVGMAVGAAIWGGCNWHHGDIDIDINRQNTFNRNVNRTTNVDTRRTNIQGNQTWQHDPSHRKGAQYRDAGTQQRFNKSGVPNPSSRDAFRGHAEQARQELARGGGAGSGGGGGASRAAARDTTRMGGGGSTHASGASASAGVGAARAGDGGFASGGQHAGGGAFDGVDQGRSAQNFSQRGSSSLDSARAGGFQGGGGSARAGGGARGGRR
jgi:Protein of unknown function (DUF3300)